MVTSVSKVPGARRNSTSGCLPLSSQKSVWLGEVEDAYELGEARESVDHIFLRSLHAAIWILVRPYMTA
jgi:hypothetical protein